MVAAEEAEQPPRHGFKKGHHGRSANKMKTTLLTMLTIVAALSMTNSLHSGELNAIKTNLNAVVGGEDQPSSQRRSGSALLAAKYGTNMVARHRAFLEFMRDPSHTPEDADQYIASQASTNSETYWVLRAAQAEEMYHNGNTAAAHSVMGSILSHAATVLTNTQVTGQQPH
jgi:hypothetical protein